MQISANPPIPWNGDPRPVNRDKLEMLIAALVLCSNEFSIKIYY
jgi:hypothetical protein